jgi:hypothetical protein
VTQPGCLAAEIDRPTEGCTALRQPLPSGKIPESPSVLPDLFINISNKMEWVEIPISVIEVLQFYISL